MKVSLIAVVTAALVTMGSAHAADLLVDNAADASPAASSIDWSGAYIGAHAGYVSATATGEEGDLFDETIDLTGWNGGVYGGVNVVNGNILFGVEGDVGTGTVEGTADFTSIEGSGVDGSLTANIDWNAHLRGRLGVVADQMLFYVSGGLAVASTSAVASLDAPVDDITSSALHTGYTVGAGIEVALTDNITLRGEYLYDDYGSQSYEYDLTDLPDPYDVVVTNDVGLTAQTVRVGLSFSF